MLAGVHGVASETSRWKLGVQELLEEEFHITDRQLWLLKEGGGGHMNFCPCRGATRSTRPRLPLDPNRPHAGRGTSIHNRSFSCSVQVKASDSESAAAEPTQESD